MIPWPPPLLWKARLLRTLWLLASGWALLDAGCFGSPHRPQFRDDPPEDGGALPGSATELQE